jgi:hypothetical protein
MRYVTLVIAICASCAHSKGIDGIHDYKQSNTSFILPEECESLILANTKGIFISGVNQYIAVKNVSDFIWVDVDVYTNSNTEIIYHQDYLLVKNTNEAWSKARLYYTKSGAFHYSKLFQYKEEDLVKEGFIQSTQLEK